MTLDFNSAKKYWVSCVHKSRRVVFGRYRSGKPRFREYCDDCQNFTEFGFAGCGLEKAIKKYGRKKVYEAQSQAGLVIRQRRPDYREYMQSDGWFSKRAEIMLRADGMCEVPGCTNEADQVHHKTYANLGNEKPDDLMAVCSSCHEWIHNGS